MTEPTDFEVTRGYRREAVEDYLQGVEAKRRELKEAIAHARARTARALEMERRISSLERRVGEWIVTAHAQTDLPQGEPKVSVEPPWASAAGGTSHG
jgi:hypothetical protein